MKAAICQIAPGLNLELWLTACVHCLPCAACSWLLLSMCLSTIDDTGCPTSQSVSPSKTPSGSEQSAHGSPILPERKTKVKRVRMMAEWSGEPRSGQRHKRELRSAMKARGKRGTANKNRKDEKVRMSRNRNIIVLSWFDLFYMRIILICVYLST